MFLWMLTPFVDNLAGLSDPDNEENAIFRKVGVCLPVKATYNPNRLYIQ